MATVKLCAFADEADKMLVGQIDALKRNGVYAIELRGLDGKNIASLTEEEATEYAKLLKDNGIEVWSLGSPLGKINIEEPREKHEEMLRHLLKMADIFGTKRIRMFSYFVKREECGKYRDEIIDRLRALVKIADGYMLCHENESEIYGATVDNCVDILDNVDGLYSVFDSSNFIQWDENIDYALEKLIDRAYYIHVKDSRYSDKFIVPVGFGDGKYDKILSELDRDATLTLEPHLFKWTGANEGDDLKAMFSYNDYTVENKNEATFSYRDTHESFDAAVTALKNLLTNCGYKEEENGLWRK